MIHDHINNLSRYDLPYREEILAFLKANDPLSLVAPEIEINGRELFVRPSEYETKSPDKGKFETHRIYADLQYVVKGDEIMQTAPADALLPLTEYDVKGDYQFFLPTSDIRPQSSDVLVRTGEFTIFFPGEAHKPCCHPAIVPAKVKKLVFKIRI